MPELFPEYDIIGILGEGANAKVFKVRHKKLDYIRAIKVLNGIVDEDDIAYRRFLDECKVLLRLGNGGPDNIVWIAQPKFFNHHASVEMEYIDGVDLYGYLEQCKKMMPISEVKKMLYDIAKALSYCHYEIYNFCINKDEDYFFEEVNGNKKEVRKNEEELIAKYKVLHNDIHSKNIIRRYDGKYILLDFGLAVESGPTRKSSSRKKGSPEYKPPEKWDNPDLLTEQSDIYSFGILAYEALTGEVPFPEKENSIEYEYKLMQMHKKEMPRPIEEKRKKEFEKNNLPWKKDYPNWLETVIFKCLEKDPNKRYKNGKELFETIKEKIEQEEKLPHQSEETEKLQKVIDKQKEAFQMADKLIFDLQTKLSESDKVNNKTNGELGARKKELSETAELLVQSRRESDVLKKETERLIAEMNKSKTRQGQEGGISKSLFSFILLPLIVAGGYIAYLLPENKKLKQTNSRHRTAHVLRDTVWKQATDRYVTDVSLTVSSYACRYTGALEDGKPNGYGKAVYTNGDVFEGKFYNGMQEYGTYEYKEGGDIFTGTFEDGKIGDGIFTKDDEQYNVIDGIAIGISNNEKIRLRN